MKGLPALVLSLAPFLFGACSTVGTSTPGSAQASERPLSFGVAAQVYPAGVIVTGHARHKRSEEDALFLRAGYNFTDRQDFGEHDNEEGDGPGFGFGWRHYYSPGADQGWLSGARLDLFFLEIDWVDDPPTPGSGATDIVVLQPAIEGGYGWNVGSGRVELTATVGAEINIHTNGEDVGEGAIGLLGVTYMINR